jgi:hypothetical protein
MVKVLMGVGKDGQQVGVGTLEPIIEHAYIRPASQPQPLDYLRQHFNPRPPDSGSSISQSPHRQTPDCIGFGSRLRKAIRIRQSYFETEPRPTYRISKPNDVFLC